MPKRGAEIFQEKTVEREKVPRRKEKWGRKKSFPPLRVLAPTFLEKPFLATTKPRERERERERESD